VIFFSDDRGFTPMSELMNPDEIAGLLTEYFTEMVDIVFEHSGSSTSSWAMRSWHCGARRSRTPTMPTAHQCALDQIETLEKMNAKWAESGRKPLAIGIGINFGEVFAGHIGSIAGSSTR